MRWQLLGSILIALFPRPALAAEDAKTSAPVAIPSRAAQIAGAASAAPEDRRAGAAVWGYDAAGELVKLREGENELICVADRPGDELFHSVCYHRSLDPYIARGRQLRAEGMEGPDTLERRHQEAETGKLAMPEGPAALYNLGGPAAIFDPESGAVNGGAWVWSIYIPHATEATTGLPTTPQAPGAPWIMRPGTASAHIMVVQPRPPANQPD